MPLTRTPWLVLVCYSLTLVIAAVMVPSWWVFWTYGLPTWFGGVFFAVLWRWVLGQRRG